MAKVKAAYEVGTSARVSLSVISSLLQMGDHMASLQAFRTYTRNGYIPAC